MAGKPGRSGGARPGAGRKPKPPTLIDFGRMFKDPKMFLLALMRNEQVELTIRVDAAKALLPFMYARTRHRASAGHWFGNAGQD